MTELPHLKTQSQNISSHTLMNGLTLVGKSVLPAIQWTGEFTKVQVMHYDELKAKEEDLTKELQKKPVATFKQKILKGLSSFNKKICRLCHQEKASESFILMCSCNHSYCYSCLNSYAISKIEDQSRVVCPHQHCHSQMKLSSSVYKYLPQQIKLMYLQFLIKNKQNKNDLNNKCLRCLQLQHSGQCKVSYNIHTIQDAFEFRKCRVCKTQANMATGKRKVNCQKCKHTFCYLCGVDWPKNGNHKCHQIQQIKKLEKEVKQQQGCEMNCFQKCQTCDGPFCCEYCDGDKCCPNLEFRCLNDCGDCIQSCCQCSNCNLGVCIGNIILFFLRLALSGLFLFFYCMMMVPLAFILTFWILIGIGFGISTFPCTIIEQCDGIGKIFAVLCCPLLMLPSIVIGPIEVSSTFSEIMSDFFEACLSSMCAMWISCSPRNLCSDC